jgi:hypothetical protein
VTKRDNLSIQANSQASQQPLNDDSEKYGEDRVPNTFRTPTEPGERTQSDRAESDQHPGQSMPMLDKFVT